MSNNGDHRRIAKVIGDMPPYRLVAEAIWGIGVDFDSDGDSAYPDAADWRELTVSLRPDSIERLDIDPLDGDREKILLKATSQPILDRAIAFLEAQGSIATAEH